MKLIATTFILSLGLGVVHAENSWGLLGSGTEADPYQICSASDFSKISSAISKENNGEGEYFKIMADIDFAGTEIEPVQFPSIGRDAITNITTVEWGFEGVLDGDGHTIKGIYHTNHDMDKKGQFNALISSLGAKGIVKNLIFSEENYVFSYNYVAPFVSVSKGLIENCTNYADINGANAFAAGICGYLIEGQGSIISCTNYGDIYAMTYSCGITGGTQSGAKVSESTDGYSGYIVEDCTNYGTMTSKNDVGIAGIAGSYSGIMINCKNFGEINGRFTMGQYPNYVGGIISCSSYPYEITGCENNGNLTGSKNVGGVLGFVMKGDGSAFTLSQCQNNGTVSADGLNIGGIAGSTLREENKIMVAYSRNTGVVSTTADNASDAVGNIRGSQLIALGEGNTIAEGLEKFTLDGETEFTTGVNNISNIESSSCEKNGKFYIDGRLVIIHNGRCYNLQGIEISNP